MLKESVVTALSEQVNAEFYSAYLYLGMSSCADRMGFKGIAHWFYVQFQEEMAHGLHMHGHILDRGAAPSYADIKAPEASYPSILAAFDTTLAHERYVTSRIDDIATLAMKENDHATYAFISWYVNEQVEEEATADGIVQKLRNIGENAALLLALDAELGARVFVDPFIKA